MKEYGVKNAWFMEDINKAGRDVEAMVKSILDDIDPKGNRPIHFSIDVDGIDPEYIPSTGTPVAGGLTIDEALKIINLVMKTGRVFSVDIVEVNLFLGTKEDSEKTLQNSVRVLQCILDN
jgi:arginase